MYPDGFALSLKRLGACRRSSRRMIPAPVLALALIFCLAARGQDDVLPRTQNVRPGLKIGMHAPDFNLPGVDGKCTVRKDYSSSKVLVVVFTCDHCP
jgi:cytochrome oxidase Cu insertion factor (SCO1/SenC/PrrC family)